MKPVIQVENLSKRYRIGTRQDGNYSTLRETLTELAASPLRRLLGWNSNGTGAAQAGAADFIWALKDISLEIQPGEVVGIIGRNGAGKSTFLKILSRITEPTSGRIRLRGRVGSLLEVGTGFHHELTGRENVYMNGSILGMSRLEINRKFDEIVAFAEIDEFLDTPVKRYSSGMFVRLAFAVAAHFEPEILIIDEVLAVGDAEFQAKCLGKMHEVAGHGRTVLFVSHNMAAIQNLCSHSAVLSGGKLTFMGPTEEAVARYLTAKGNEHDGYMELEGHPSRRRGCQTILKSVRFLDDAGNEKSRFATGEALNIELEVDPAEPLRAAQFGIFIDSWMGGRVFSLATYLSESGIGAIDSACSVRCRVAELPLVPGRYTISLAAGIRGHLGLDVLDEAVHFDVEGGDYFGNGSIPHPTLGLVAVRSQWEKCPQLSGRAPAMS
jgi:lipopolysaccharide transport system ATP-binding protein